MNNKILKFLCIGGGATLLQYILLIIFVSNIGITPLYASIISYIISGIANYYASYYFTFQCNSDHTKTSLKFIVTASIGLLLNSIIFYISNTTIGLNYIIAQIISTSIVLIWNFTANLTWTFKNEEQ